jgi:hypothetical protein
MTILRFKLSKIMDTSIKEILITSVEIGFKILYCYNLNYKSMININGILHNLLFNILTKKYLYEYIKVKVRLEIRNDMSFCRNIVYY